MRGLRYHQNKKCHFWVFLSVGKTLLMGQLASLKLYNLVTGNLKKGGRAHAEAGALSFTMVLSSMQCKTSALRKARNGVGHFSHFWPLGTGKSCHKSERVPNFWTSTRVYTNWGGLLKSRTINVVYSLDIGPQARGRKQGGGKSW